MFTNSQRVGRRRWLVGLSVVSILCGAVLLAAAGLRSPAPSIIVRDQMSGEVFYETKGFDESTVIELSWIHSVEHEPWVERYHPSGTRIILDEVILKGYGAGVPAELEGTTQNINGVIRTTGINRPLEKLSWVHSHATHHVLKIGNKELSTEIPHQSFVELVIE